MPNPKNRGGGDVAPLEGTQTTEGATPPQDGPENNGGDKTPPPTPPSERKKRIKNADLKGKNINIGDGNIIAVDENGIFEVDEAQCTRLLSIPGYEEA